jgi:hypothetical protein
MPDRIDLIGRRFGRWVVIAYAGDRKWSCVCDCGARVDVAGWSLRKGDSKSCGCRPKWIDLTGKRLGRLLVTAYAGNKKWSCVCDCGARVVVRGSRLRESITKSCGCLTREPDIDLSGKRFGRLVAITYARNKWSCVCDCRLIALHEINVAITKLRERNGLAPIDDALPGERPNVFIRIKEQLFPRKPKEAAPDRSTIPVHEQMEAVK